MENTARTPEKKPVGALDSFFKLSERNTTVRTELLAGLTTFMTMAYILGVNPGILSAAGMPAPAVFTATALAAAIACLYMGLVANMPIALASGMGLNAFFAFGIVVHYKLPWEFALTVVLVEGIIFMALTLGNVREAIVNCIPINVKYAITAGIGLFIAFIGFKGAGIIQASEATFVTLGNFQNAAQRPGMLVAVLGVLITVALMARQVKGSLLWGMLAATLIGIPLGVTDLSKFSFAALGQIPSLEPVAFKCFQWEMVQNNLGLFFFALLTLLLANLFDTVGTLIGVASKANMLDKDGKLPGVSRALMADAVGTTCGAMLGTSVVAAYVESASGVSEGGRTGLTAVTVAGLFLVALFLAPVFLMIPAAATAPALIIVGFLMMESVHKLILSDVTEGIPAFLAIIIMPLSYSIVEGIGFGVVSYVIIKALSGRAKDVHPATWVVGIIFILKYAFLGAA